MSQKRSFGVTLLGCVIVLSTALFFLPLFHIRTQHILGSLSNYITFTLIPYLTLIETIFKISLATQGQPISLILRYLISLSVGIGILRLSNTARICAILISLYIIIEGIFTAVADMKTGGSFSTMLPNILVHTIYVIFLTRASVAAQFTNRNK